MHRGHRRGKGGSRGEGVRVNLELLQRAGGQRAAVHGGRKFSERGWPLERMRAVGKQQSSEAHLPERQYASAEQNGA